MKKSVIILAIVLGLSMTTYADGNRGGLFQRGETPEQTRDGGMPALPSHGQTGNQNAPLGSGIAVLMGLGVAYAIGKRNKEK